MSDTSSKHVFELGDGGAYVSSGNISAQYYLHASFQFPGFPHLQDRLKVIKIEERKA